MKNKVMICEMFNVFISKLNFNAKTQRRRGILIFLIPKPPDCPKTNLGQKPQSLEGSKNLVLKVFNFESLSLRGYSFVFRQSAQLGNVEFWLAKLLARLAEQASRSGGLSKQEDFNK